MDVRSIKTILKNLMTIIAAQVENADGTPQAYKMDISGLVAQNNTLLAAHGTSDDSGGEQEPDAPAEPDEPDVPEVILTGISAAYSGGSVPVVTAHYSDGTSGPVTGYTLSGTIAQGSNTITVTYQNKTTGFTVTGVAEEAMEYTAYYLQTNTTLSNKPGMVTDGGSYETMVTADDGYQITNIRVEMGEGETVNMSRITNAFEPVLPEGVTVSDQLCFEGADSTGTVWWVW